MNSHFKVNYDEISEVFLFTTINFSKNEVKS